MRKSSGTRSIAKTLSPAVLRPASADSNWEEGGYPGGSDSKPLTAAGQIFRISMYHPNHPDGSYQTANRVQAFDPPSTISWEPGYDADDGTLRIGGWTWRYDFTPDGPANTTVTLSYD